MSTANVADNRGSAAVVEMASYRWAFIVLAYALLVDVAYRSFFRGEAAWDLLAFVVGAGVVGAAYQARHRALSRTGAWMALLTACLAALVALVR